MLKLVGLVGFGAMLGIGVVNSASAQTLQSNAALIFSGNGPNWQNGTQHAASLLVDGVTIAFAPSNSFGYDDGGQSLFDLFMVPTSGPVPGVIIEAANGDKVGSSALEPILSFACTNTPNCSAGGIYDLSLTRQLTATVSPGGTPITGASLAEVVSPNPPPGANLGSETIQYTTVNPVNGKLIYHSLCSMNAPSGSCSFAPQTSVVATKDLGLDDLIIDNGQTLNLSSITENFSVPEPASLAPLLSAMVALGLVRGRRRRT